MVGETTTSPQGVGATTYRAKSAVVRYGGEQQASGEGEAGELSSSIDRRPHTAGSALLRSSLNEHNKLCRYSAALGNPQTSSSAGPPPSRLLEPDDCCHYCELYQEDRIAAARHRSTNIVAWAQDVTRTMQDSRNQARPVRKRQKISFLKYEPPGKPAGLEGYRKVKAVPGKKKCDLLNNTKMFGEDTVADVASNLAHLAVKFDSERNGPPHGPGKLLIPLPQKRSARASAKRINGESLKSAAADSIQGENAETARMTARSCSNELLNVITIDDAYKRHRQRLMNQRPTWEKDENKDDDENDDSEEDSDEDYPEFCESRAITDGRTTESRAITDGRTTGRQTEFRALSQFESSESRPGTTPNETPRKPPSAKRETIRLRSDLTLRQLSPTSPTFVVEQEKYETVEDTPIDGPNENVLRAIDGMILSRNVVRNSAHTGLYRHGNFALPNQPESRRFQKLNRKLHKLIETDYAPNRFSERIKDESKKRMPLNNGHILYNGNNRPSEIGSARSENSNDRFLYMLMDMDKNRERKSKGSTQ